MITSMIGSDSTTETIMTSLLVRRTPQCQIREEATVPCCKELS